MAATFSLLVLVFLTVAVMPAASFEMHLNSLLRLVGSGSTTLGLIVALGSVQVLLVLLLLIHPMITALNNPIIS